MRHLSVVGLDKDRKEILAVLQRAGVLQLTDLSSPAEGQQKNYVEGEAEPLDTKQQLRQQESFSNEQLRSRLVRAIGELERRFPEEEAFFGTKVEVSPRHFLQVGERAELIEKKLGELERLLQRETELAAEQQSLKQGIALLEPWREVNLDAAALETGSTDSVLGQFPDAQRQREFQLWAEKQAVPASVEKLSSIEKNALVAVVMLRPDRAAVRSRLLSLGFREVPFKIASGSPAEEERKLEGELAAAAKEQRQLQLQIHQASDLKGEFKLLHDFLGVQEDSRRADAHLSRTKYTFSLAGWLPKNKAEQLSKMLTQRFFVAADLRPPYLDEKPPVLLQNDWFGRSFQSILEMFGAPDPGETDPTPVMAPFYFLFFGMMLSDVGYGAMLSLICAGLLFGVKVKGEMNKMARLLFLSGISSIIWGFVFGGFFGNLVTVVTQGKYNFPVLWFDPMKDSMKLMIWSMLFGVVHLFAGMSINVYNLVQDGKAFDAVVDVLPWFFVITGLGLLLGGGAGALGPYSPMAAQAGKWMAVGGAIVLVLFGGRDSKNPIFRLLKGLLSLYGITGYFSDILSYTRILALVLATNVIAIVVNKMGFMGGPTPMGYIVFVLVGLFGHTLNLSLSALSAYVHSSRLQYVEFFGKFFQGGGRYWKPLRLETKYVDVAQDPLSLEETSPKVA